jgi:hypothetical protein
MSHLQPFPTTHTHSSTRLTHAQAHSFLCTFLETADSNPAYRPDSTLTVNGPVSTSAGSGTNLTLANLKRVLAGMAGQRVGGLPSRVGQGKSEEEDADGGRPAKRPKRNVEVDGAGEVVVDEQAEKAEGEWQDKEDFDMEQEEMQEPLAEAQHHEQPALGEGSGQVDDEHEAELDAVSGGTKKQAATMDKEERKRLKKERAQEDKKKRADERKKRKTT